MSAFLQVPGDVAPKPMPKIPSNVLDQFKMTGKVVAISGAGAGIGFAVAEAMAEAGANVAILYNSNKEAIQKAADLAQRTGTKVQAYQCGVTSYEAVESTVSTIVKDFGRLDVFVANSGVAYSGPLIDEPIEEWKRVVDVNYNGVAYCAKAAGKVFRDQGKGNMIITASMSGSIVNLNPQAGYNSSKAAVIHLARSLAQEWAPFARVNTISPGYIDTDLGAAPEVQTAAYRMAALGRQGHTNELKGAYLYLASDASTFCTGHDMVVDGGYTLP